MKPKVDAAAQALYDRGYAYNEKTGQWSRHIPKSEGVAPAEDARGNLIDGTGSDPVAAHDEIIPSSDPVLSAFRTVASEYKAYTETLDKAKEIDGVGGYKTDPAKSKAYVPAWTKATITQGYGPTDEELDGPYNGYAHFNKGYDYGLPEGTPIDAIAGGTVISAGDAGDNWGLSVKIKDADGFTHNYGHLSSVNVKPGQAIGAGTVLGASGNTGNSRGAHLSYDVWDSNGVFVNPGRWVSGGADYDPTIPSAPKVDPDPLKTFLGSGKYKLEEARTDEMDRQYGKQAARAKDYLSIAGNANNLIADQAAMKKASQAMSDEAQAAALKINAAVQKGDLNWYDRMAGPIWSDPLANLYKQLQTAPPGFVESFLHNIQKDVPDDYNMNEVLGLPPQADVRWGRGTSPLARYAAGTVDWRDQPYLEILKNGGSVPPTIRARLEASGAINGPAPAGSSTGDQKPPPTAGSSIYGSNASSESGPGRVPANSLITDPTQRIYDDTEWAAQAAKRFAANITAGNAVPPGWGLDDLTQLAGQPASSFPGEVMDRIMRTILQHADSPEVVQAFGQRPGIPTTWVDNPAAPKAATPKGASTGSSGGAVYSGGGGAGTQYSGVYGGAAAQGDPDLDKKLAWEAEQFKWQKELQQAQLVLQQGEAAGSQAYREAQMRWGDANAKLQESQLKLQEINSVLQQKQFDEALRRAQVDEAYTGQRIDMDRVKQEADIEFQRQDMELKRQAGALDQAQFDEAKRQFEQTYGLQREQFDYQKTRDEKEQNLKRAQTVADLGAHAGNAVQSQFFYAGMADPVGTKYDAFTGEATGQGTWTDVQNEDAHHYKKPVPALARGSGLVRDLLAIVGDSAKTDAATGNEELIWNPTRAPIGVVNNGDAKKTGLVPPRGKKFSDHVRLG